MRARRASHSGIARMTSPFEPLEALVLTPSPHFSHLPSPAQNRRPALTPLSHRWASPLHARSTANERTPTSVIGAPSHARHPAENRPTDVRVQALL
jgi:hypothetical protein